MPSGIAAIIQARKSGDWLTPALSKGAEVEEEGWGRTRTYVRPSSGGGVCERDIQLSQLGHSTGFAEKSRDRMDNGTMAHTRITAKMQRSNVLVEADVSIIEFVDGFAVFDNLRGAELEALIKEHGYVTWRGSLDVVVRKNPTDKIIYVGELKTANTRKYDALPKQETDLLVMARILLRVEPNYTRQVSQYLVMLKKHIAAWNPEYTVANEIFLLYEHTDTQAYRVIWFRPDEDLLADAFKRPNLSVEASRAGVLLERPFEQGSRTCNSCFQKRVCNALSNGDEEEWTSVKKALQSLSQELAGTSEKSEPT